MGVLPAWHLCVMCMQCPQRPEEGVRSPGTGVNRVVSHHVGAGNRTLVLWKSSQCASLQVFSSAPRVAFGHGVYHSTGGANEGTILMLTNCPFSSDFLTH